jgi:hypothetical protein
MTQKHKSPYGSSFRSAIRRGTPWLTAVETIAKRWKKTPQQVWESLYKAGYCYRTKFNGQWLYWPKQASKTTAQNWKPTQYWMWQWYMNWCVSSGQCTPEQLWKKAGPQKQFQTFCRKFWNRQYPKQTHRKRTTRRQTKSYRFPTTKSRITRRYRKAA